MALKRSGINIDFSAGDYRSANTDANGFWLTVGTYTSTTDVALNQTTIDVSDLILRHAFTGTQFTNFTLYVFLRAYYRLDGGTITYKYLFGDSNGASVGQKSMTGGTTTLISGASISSVVIPHNADGTRPDVIIQGYCDSTSTASYVPASTTANTSAFSFDDLPRPRRYDSSGHFYNATWNLRYDGAHWVHTSNRLRYDGTHWINGF